MILLMRRSNRKITSLRLSPFKNRSSCYSQGIKGVSALGSQYLPLPLHDPNRNLRSSDTLQIVISMEKHTFQDSAANFFNSLPVNLRSCNVFHRFNELVTNVFKQRAQLRLAEMHVIAFYL